MKKTLLLVLSLVTTLSFAQDFEGEIVYNLEIQGGESAEQMRGMMPNSIQAFVKGTNSRSTMHGGLLASMMGDILVKKSESRSYTLMPNLKTAYYTELKASPISKDDATVTPTKETATIMGYKCVKYNVVPKQNDDNSTIVVWATKDLKINPDMLSSDFLDVGKLVDGFPLRIEIKLDTPETGLLQMAFNVEKVEEKKLDASIFEIPADYKVEPASNMNAGMGGF